jgi:hypothetical protein
MSLTYKENLWGRFEVIEVKTERRLGYIFRNKNVTEYKFYPNDITPISEETSFAIYQELRKLNGPSYIS